MSQASLHSQAVAREMREQRDKFIERVQREEDLAMRDPQTYRNKVRWLAFLGYGYIFGVLSLLLAVVGGIVALVVFSHRANAGVFKLLIVTVPLIWAILRALMVRLPAPEGIPLTRADAPKLWEDVDEISKRLNAPPIHRIVLDEDFNMAAAQVPRFGMFGPTRNIMVVGLPILMAVTKDEAKGIIAHELGHFSGNHGRFGGKIYRLNRTWERLQEQFEGGGHWLFSKFFNWFTPLFAATTFALRRQNEYDADRAAKEVVGAEVFATALLRTGYAHGILQERFWQPFYKRVETDPLPPPEIFGRLAPVAQASVDPAFVRSKIDKAMLVPTEYDDTHPSTRDRVAAIGIDPDHDRDPWAARLAEKVEPTAAEAYLGASLPKLVKTLDAALIASMHERWAEAHREHQARVGELAALRTKAESTPLSEEEVVEKARLTAIVEGSQAAIDEFRALVNTFPKRADAHFWLGSALLEAEDEAGIDHLEQARKLDPEFGIHVIQEIAEYRARQGDREALRQLQDAALDVVADSRVYEAHAHRIELSDDFIPSDYDGEAKEVLRAQFAKRKDVLRAYLVRKRIPTHPERPVTVLIVLSKFGFVVDANEARTALLTKLTEEMTFSSPLIVFVVEKPKPWDKRMAEVPGSLIFDVKE